MRAVGMKHMQDAPVLLPSNFEAKLVIDRMLQRPPQRGLYDAPVLEVVAYCTLMKIKNAQLIDRKVVAVLTALNLDTFQKAEAREEADKKKAREKGYQQ